MKEKLGFHHEVNGWFKSTCGGRRVFFSSTIPQKKKLEKMFLCLKNHFFGEKRRKNWVFTMKLMDDPRVLVVVEGCFLVVPYPQKKNLGKNCFLWEKTFIRPKFGAKNWNIFPEWKIFVWNMQVWIYIVPQICPKNLIPTFFLFFVGKVWNFFKKLGFHHEVNAWSKNTCGGNGMFFNNIIPIKNNHEQIFFY